MPTIYLNGGSPNYTGAIFTNATELLALIKQTLEDAGWLTITYDPGVNLFIKGTTLINSHNCWVEFAISGTTLTIRGWLEEAKTNGSPNSIHIHSFVIGANNRLWLTADEDSGCICIFSDSTGVSAGSHFGFLQRIDTSDQWAWMIGRIHALGHLYAYSAKSKHNLANWKLLSADYYQCGLVADSRQVEPSSTYDFVCHGQVGSISMTDANSGQNAFVNAHLGRRNYNNQAVITPFSYLEGRGSMTAYGSGLSLYFRGFVKHTFCGVASESAVAQVLDPVTNNRILSVGGSQWQGIRIL